MNFNKRSNAESENCQRSNKLGKIGIECESPDWFVFQFLCYLGSIHTLKRLNLIAYVDHEFLHRLQANRLIWTITYWKSLTKRFHNCTNCTSKVFSISWNTIGKAFCRFFIEQHIWRHNFFHLFDQLSRNVYEKIAEINFHKGENFTHRIFFTRCRWDRKL